MTDNSIKTIFCDNYSSNDAIRDQCIEKFVTDELVPVVPNAANIITFDGFNGVGKSTLAGHLAQKCGLLLIGIDNFLEKDQRAFLDALKLDKLEKAISEALGSQGRVIIEGCLIDAALERIGKAADFRVYVMQTSRRASSHNTEQIEGYDILFGDRSAHELIEMRENELAQLPPDLFGDRPGGRVSGLKRELIHYHEKRRPHDLANIIIKMMV